jgi:CubicO group peptidase (beta-lactamase class C family)
MNYSKKSGWILFVFIALPIFAQNADTPPDHNVIAPKLQPFVDDSTIPGAVMLVVTKDKVADVETVGYSDAKAKTPMKPDALFWIASMSKAFTTTCVMMLVDEGKVNLDDPVEKYLPEFKGQVVIDPKDPTKTPHPVNHPITVKEVMSHSSGLPKLSAAEKEPLDRLPLAVAAASYGKTPLLFQPGTDYMYSNAGINTSARIIEVVSGMSYEDFMQKRLFDPLGLKDTTFWPTQEQLTRLAKCYLEKDNPRRLEEVPLRQLTYPLDKKEGRYPIPAGGLFSTASDIGKFLQLYLNDGMVDGKRILSPEAIKKLTTKEANTHEYGFGWEILKDGAFRHGGADQTYMSVYPKAGIGAVLMTQVPAPWVNKNEIKKIFSVLDTTALQFGNGSKTSAAAGRVEGQ